MAREGPARWARMEGEPGEGAWRPKIGRGTRPGQTGRPAVGRLRMLFDSLVRVEVVGGGPLAILSELGPLGSGRSSSSPEGAGGAEVVGSLLGEGAQGDGGVVAAPAAAVVGDELFAPHDHAA